MHQVYISWRSLAPQFSCSLSARRRTSYFVSRGHEFVKTVHPGPFSSPGPRNTFYKQTSAFVQEGITLAYSVQVILFRFPLHYSPTSYKWSSAASVRGRGQLDTFGFTPHKVNRCCRWFFFSWPKLWVAQWSVLVESSQECHSLWRQTSHALREKNPQFSTGVEVKS